MAKEKVNPWMISTVVLVSFILGFFAGAWHGGGIAGDGIKDADKPEIKLGDRKGGTEGVLGDPDAPVTLEEFSDYQCPYCAKFAANTMPQIISEYVDTGKVKFVYKDFPLTRHPAAAEAAVAARCAGDQNNYWGMHDALFLNLSTWASADDPTEVFVEIAKALKLNKKKFITCLASGEYDPLVEADRAEGMVRGVTGTPNFFVNDKKVVGGSLSAFRSIIDAELNPVVPEEVEVPAE